MWLFGGASRGAGLILLLAASLLLACGEPFSASGGAGGGGKGGTVGVGGTVGAGGTAGAGGGAAEGGGCAITAPEVPGSGGWQGPVAVASKTGMVLKFPTCDNDKITYGTNVIAPDADCECHCTSDVSSCDIGIIQSTGDCSVTVGSPTSIATMCTELGGGGGGGAEAANAKFASPDAPMTATGACSPTEQVMPALAKFGIAWRSCHLDSVARGNELCIQSFPAGYEDTVCIFNTGDHECTVAGYSNKLIVYADIKDTRKCTENCECPTGSMDCIGNVEFYTNVCNSTPDQTLTPADTCLDISGATHAKFAATLGGCEPTNNPQPEGSASGEAPVTWCCTAPPEVPSTNSQP